MAYPNFGKVKTIVLPIPYSWIGIDEYKEKYGIDLKEFIKLNFTSKSIELEKSPNTLILIDLSDSIDYAGFIGLPALVPLGSFSVMDPEYYDSGVNDATLNYMLFKYSTDDGLLGLAILRFRISKDDDFSYDNLKISVVDY